MLIQRMIRAARLDSTVFDEVEHDLTATTQALYVVLIVSVASGIGSALATILAGFPGEAVGNLFGGVIGSVIGWVVWSLVTFWIGTTFMGGTSTPGEMLRVIGFAYTPNILGFFSFIFCIGPLIALAGAIWALVAGVIAIREAMDFETGKAVITVILGWLAMLVIILLFAALGITGLGLFM
jgi:hypothetical protein